MDFPDGSKWFHRNTDRQSKIRNQTSALLWKHVNLSEIGTNEIIAGFKRKKNHTLKLFTSNISIITTI